MESPTTASGNLSQKVTKSDAEWKAQLTPEQYFVLRKSGTEAPHGDAYQRFESEGEGSYLCAGCEAVLFTSTEKFHSGCGWPSFYDAADANHVFLKKDISMGMLRTEVICAVCNGHLGHVFEGEGYDTPTNQRYCINGGGLMFVPSGNE